MSKAKPGAILMRGGERYVCVLLKVQERDGSGRPRSLTILYDEESTTIRGGEEFLTAYILESNLAPQVAPAVAGAMQTGWRRPPQ